jgi:alkanesulfonate monooxygenase SsuD/methylene tetrahydromethanopterin reductase-like flavin-dependent oxidoreductase (luciferase family)
VSPLHFGVILPNYGPELDAEQLAGVAVAAENAGLDSAWVTDHLIVPAEHAGVYGTIAEALVSLGFLAARTRRLKLGVSALVVPLRNPLVALKQLATLDFLSGGRIVTGGGVRDSPRSVRWSGPAPRRVARARWSSLRSDARACPLRGASALARRLDGSGARPARRP